jgi:hypothetical protein
MIPEDIKLTVHVYQSVTVREIHDTVEKIKLKKLYKRKIFVGYGVLIAVTMWLITDMVLDYFSHIGADEPLFP